MRKKTVSMRTGLLALLISLLAGCGGASEAPVTPVPQAGTGTDDAAAAAAATITAADMGRLIGALAHDSAMGRDTPSRELEKAAEYIAARFRSLGLQPAGENGT